MAGAGAAGNGAGAAPPVVGWIDSDMLEEKDEDSICALCLGVMVKPAMARGCPEGHCFCRSCLVKALAQAKRCPTCRADLRDDNKLVPNRTAENFIAKMWLRCELAEGNEAGGPPAGKRAKLAPAAFMSVSELRTELRLHGLKTPGTKPELVARLEEGRKQGKCRWRGRVGDLGAHLAECIREVQCNHCTQRMECRLLAEHEVLCSDAKIECPNEGCSAQHHRDVMNLHRAVCEHEEVTCPCPGCDERLLRKDSTRHVTVRHLQSAVELLESAWAENAALKGNVAASAESEQRLAASSPTSWVFNWRADGWGLGVFHSEDHTFRGEVEGFGTLECCDKPEHSHFIGFKVSGIDQCKVHATFSILDKHDKILRKIHEMGLATKPREIDDSDLWGKDFTPTAEDKSQSVRADGSIRLRVVVRLFLDDEA